MGDRQGGRPLTSRCGAGGRTLDFTGRAAHSRVLAEGLRVDRSRCGPRGPRRGGGPELLPCAPSPLYDQYCKDHFRDGHCDQGCNSAECEWDGLDCAEHVPERLAAGTLVLVVLMPPEQLRNRSLHFLRELSRLLHTNVVFKRDASGQQMIFPYYGREEELHKHPVRRSVDGGAPLLPGGSGRRQRRELDPMDIRG